MERIKAWLESKGSFDEGFALYAPRCKNRILLNTISRKRDMRKLRYELDKIANGRKPLVLAVTKPSRLESIPLIPQDPQERIKIVHEGRIRYEDLPEPMQAIYDAAREDYRLMVSLHEKLKLAGADEDRKAIYKQLCATDDAHRDRWAVIDEWAQSGKLPEEGSTPQTGNPTYKEVNAARLAISRCLDQLAIASDPVVIEQQMTKAREKVSIVLAAGGKFDKLQPKLKKYGIL